jgi:NADPH-dependent curcumin reductase CurA
MTHTNTNTNTRVIFAKIPTEYPVPGEHLVVEKVPFDATVTDLAEGDILLKNLVLSVDPYMRGRMRPPTIKSYFPAFELNKALQGHGVSEVIKSANEKFKVGDWVYGITGWEEYTHVPASFAQTFEVFNHIKNSGLPVTYYVGAIGMPGMTAYIGMYKHAQPIKKGETLFISAAAGAVGQIVGQIGKHEGLRVVGSVGDDAKVDYLLKECGFDAAFNYKKHDTGEKLKELCPDGIDIYFENVGGRTLELVIDNVNNFARIVACGMISQYNTQNPYPIRNLGQVVSKRIKIEGFIYSDSADEYSERFYRDMEKWLKSGQMKYKDDVVEGIANAPKAFVDLFEGKNFGKKVIKVVDV